VQSIGISRYTCFNLKDQMQQCLSVISSGIQQTVVSEVIDKNGDDFS